MNDKNTGIFNNKEQVKSLFKKIASEIENEISRGD